MPFNLEDLLEIMGHGLASLLRDRIYEDKHQLDHPSGYQRMYYWRHFTTSHFDEAEGLSIGPYISTEAKGWLGQGDLEHDPALSEGGWIIVVEGEVQITKP